MFISKAEKEDLFYRIRVLEQEVLAFKTAPLYATQATKSRKGRDWSPEQRAEASARMKKIQADIKAKKEKV